MSLKIKHISKLFVIILLLSFSSCSKFKRIVSNDAETILKNELRIKYLEKKKPEYILIENASIKIEGKDSNRAKMNFYFEKDQFFFVSLKLIGFEMMRFQLSKDSVKFINRIKREYYFEDLKNVQLELGGLLDFYNLENLVTTGFVSNERTDFDNFFINSKISGDSLQFKSELEAGQNVLCTYSLSGLQLFELAYLDYVKQIETNVFFERSEIGLNSIHGIFYFYGDPTKFNLDIKEIKNEKYTKTDFRIGRNYNEIESLF